MMKKKLIRCLFLAILSLSRIYAQEMVIAPAEIISDYELSEKAQSQILMKLQKSISQQGISTTENAVFAIVPKISILSEHTSSGIPPIAEVEYDISFSLQNIFDGKSFASFPITIQSRGSNKANAIVMGLKKINLNTPEFSSFLKRAKQKTIAHYEAELPKIIQKAEVAMKQKRYEDALFVLSQVPEAIPSYSKVLTLMEKNYQGYEETYARQILQKAKALWAANKGEHTAREVAELLAEIPANTSANKEANPLLQQISKYVSDREQFERKLIERQQQHQHLEKRARIEAAKAIGVAYGKNSGTKVILWR